MKKKISKILALVLLGSFGGVSLNGMENGGTVSDGVRLTNNFLIASEGNGISLPELANNLELIRLKWLNVVEPVSKTQKPTQEVMQLVYTPENIEYINKRLQKDLTRAGTNETEFKNTIQSFAAQIRENKNIRALIKSVFKSSFEIGEYTVPFWGEFGEIIGKRAMLPWKHVGECLNCVCLQMLDDLRPGLVKRFEPDRTLLMGNFYPEILKGEHLQRRKSSSGKGVGFVLLGTMSEVVTGYWWICSNGKFRFFEGGDDSEELLEILFGPAVYKKYLAENA